MPNLNAFAFHWGRLAPLLFCTGVALARSEPAYGGTPLGPLPDAQGIGLSGDVYVVNSTCVQVLNMTYTKTGQDVYFFVDIEQSVTSGGIKLPTLEYGNHALSGYERGRAVLLLPAPHAVTDFRSVGLYDPIAQRAYSSVPIPADVRVPRGQFLNGTFHGIRYGAKSAGVWVLDRRTIVVQRFTFRGVKAPATYFVAGRGPFIKQEAGAKMRISTGGAGSYATRLVRNYRNENLVVKIPESYPYDIYGVDWVSLYCSEFRIDLASIRLMRLKADIPPYVPEAKLRPLINLRKPDTPVVAWKRPALYGWPKSRTNFTFQLGPSGGRRAYQAWNHGQIANDYVWYVNGYMAPVLVLQRDVQYRFIVQGGDNDDVPLYTYNPLYVGTDKHGGYATLLHDDNKKAYPVYAGLDFRGRILKGAQKSVGFLCMWRTKSAGINADMYDSFAGYHGALRIGCVKHGAGGSFTWKPYAETPDKLYYQSYTNFNMGGEIRIVDRISPDDAERDSPDLEYEIDLIESHALSSAGVTRLAQCRWTMLVAAMVVYCCYVGLCPA